MVFRFQETSVHIKNQDTTPDAETGLVQCFLSVRSLFCRSIQCFPAPVKPKSVAFATFEPGVEKGENGRHLLHSFDRVFPFVAPGGNFFSLILTFHSHSATVEPGARTPERPGRGTPLLVRPHIFRNPIVLAGLLTGASFVAPAAVFAWTGPFPPPGTAS